MGTHAIAGAIHAKPCCGNCGSSRVVKDAWACFNPDTGLWELETVFDQAFCQQCEKQTELVWSQTDQPPDHRIRDLNDRFRMQGLGNGSMMVTSGIQAEGEAFLLKAAEAVKNFSDFNEDNDPWGEHDFGAIDIEGQKVFFKLDYYTPDLTAGSENPANEGMTHRVLTIMLASEY